MIDINGATLGVTRDDNTDVNIDIDPITVEVDGVISATGVYEISIQTQTEENIDAGRLAFHLEDKFDWEYIGDLLSDDEIEQVISFIQEQTEVDFFSRPKKTDRQRLEAAMYHHYKSSFIEDNTKTSTITFDGKHVLPANGSIDLNDFFKGIISTFSNL